MSTGPERPTPPQGGPGGRRLPQGVGCIRGCGTLLAFLFLLAILDTLVPPLAKVTGILGVAFAVIVFLLVMWNWLSSSLTGRR